MSDEEQELDDAFSKMDADGDGVITRDEFEAAQKNGPTLTGDVAFFQEEEEGPETPDDRPKEMMNKNLQFFLGVVVYPILVLIVSSLFGSIGWAFDESGQVSGFLQMMTMGGGYVGGAVLGFTSGHHSFAWGVLASVIVIPMLIFALFFGFCMLIIMTGDGTLI
ncbi:MAG: EF-hand domain-containing protein [Candidatus Thermoplasmatota archaeon]|nr:EF-hand domain-containing protein [Candidatus Thermoplasmatota archaeon]